jgi:Ca2+-binding EF-hand superfamily protein
MGNDIGKGANRMAIAAMANVTQFEKQELLALQRKFHELAKRGGNVNTISRNEFREALESVGISESDTEILDRLFTMFDKTGDDQVNFREFIVGISPLITGDVISKLNFSFELYDLDGAGTIRKNEMCFILNSMNGTASYFGDPVMTSAQVDLLVDEVFTNADVSETGTLNYAEYMNAVASHPILVSFITGAGTVRYGAGK